MYVLLESDTFQHTHAHTHKAEFPTAVVLAQDTCTAPRNHLPEWREEDPRIKIDTMPNSAF